MLHTPSMFALPRKCEGSCNKPASQGAPQSTIPAATILSIRDEDKDMPNAASATPDPRLNVDDRAQCRARVGHDDDAWSARTIVKQWHHDRGAEVFWSYQIKLDMGDLVYVTMDNDRAIRALITNRTFSVVAFCKQLVYLMVDIKILRRFSGRRSTLRRPFHTDRQVLIQFFDRRAALRRPFHNDHQVLSRFFVKTRTRRRPTLAHGSHSLSQ